MHPVALNLGSFAIHWYGIFMAVGVIVGMWTAGRRAQLEKVPAETVLDFGPWLIVGAIVGARLLFVFSYWDEEFAGKPLWNVFTVRSGFVFYGGLIGAALVCIWWTRRHRIPLWKFADILAPSVALGHLFGRVGCFMTGCCYGKVCTLPWGVQFPAGHETHPHYIHPVQLYESVLNLGLYVGLAWLYRRKKFDGQVFAIYLLGYAVLRWITEAFRGDYGPASGMGALTPGQLTGILILAAGIGLFWKLPRRIVPFQGFESGGDKPS